MGQPAAKQGDTVVAVDTHIVMVPAPPGSPVPTPLPHPFNGILNSELSADVNVMGLAAATVGSKAANTPAHIPTPPGVSFQSPPSNQAVVETGSQSVKINGKAAARLGDTAKTCNDPTDLPVGTVVASGTVLIGG
jgi:uncharacterized Zn-binding protein involved in type VI secretion